MRDCYQVRIKKMLHRRFKILENRVSTFMIQHHSGRQHPECDEPQEDDTAGDAAGRGKDIYQNTRRND